jgi:hypothetical protein
MIISNSPELLPNHRVLSNVPRDILDENVFVHGVPELSYITNPEIVIYTLEDLKPPLGRLKYSKYGWLPH